MSILDGLFGNSGSTSSDDQGHSSDFVSSLDSALGFNAESQHSSSSTDADGSSSSSSSDNSLGFATSTDGLLHSIESAFSSHDAAHG